MRKETDGRSGPPSRDCVIVEGINARGFGTVPKAVMRDPELAIEAKGIYAYLCSFAGGGQTAFPSRSTMLAELGLSKDRFYKYRNVLVDRGLVRIERRSEGNVAHPVRTNVYILSSTLPDCYRKQLTSAPPSDCDALNTAGVSPQVRNDVRKTRTTMESFPQSAGRKGRPCFQDIVETRTTNCPENKDTDEKDSPSSAIANGEGIKNSLRIDSYPTVQSKDFPLEVESEFARLSSPDRTPNRNRIRDALASYGEVRLHFPAAVIGAAWDRRQKDARESGRPARFYPQLAKWLEDPGPDGAMGMCKAEMKRREKQEAAKLSVALSLDEVYMAMREEASSLASLEHDGAISPSNERKLSEIETAMAAIRDEKASEIAAASGRIV